MQPALLHQKFGLPLPLFADVGCAWPFRHGRHISTVPDAAVEDGGSDVLEGGGGALVPRAALDEEAVRDVRRVVDAQPDGDDQVVARHLRINCHLLTFDYLQGDQPKR